MDIKINTLAKLTFIGLVYIYTTKLIDTFYHGIFRPIEVAGTIAGLNLLAGLFQLLFFIALYRQFTPKDKQLPQIAAWLAIIGSAVAMLPKAMAMGILFQPQSLFFFIRNSKTICALCPWLAAVLLFAFSLLFFLDEGFRLEKDLKYAFACGATGWFIMVAAQSLVAINYLTAGELVWLTDLFTAGPLVFVTASSVTFLGLSIFYPSFARHCLERGLIKDNPNVHAH